MTSMENTAIISATYGSQNTSCEILIVEKDGGSWYCIKGSQNVNFTYQELNPGVYAETIKDVDYHHAKKPINTLQQLIKAVNS
jgi:hypothetical protein